MKDLLINIKPKYPIKVLINMSKLLDCFIKENRPIKLNELEKKLDFYPSTIHRILDTLRYLGYIEHVTDSNKYQLGIKCLELGMSKLSQITIIKEASPYLDKLCLESNENVYLGVLFDDVVIYQAKKEAKRSVKVDTHVGTRAYAHCTALGKVLVAFLDRDEREKIYENIGFPKVTKNTIINKDLFEEELKKVRKEGFAVDNEENEYDIRCIATPIRDYTGTVIAAISISGPSYRFNIKKQRQLTDKILKYSRIISQKIGYVTF